VDPLTAAALSATLIPLVTGAAGEAGKAAWASLASYVRSKLRHDPAAVAAVGVLEQQPADVGTVTKLAVSLAAEADRDTDAAAWLRTWHDDAAKVTATVTHNTISGTVHGNAVQGGNIGSVTF